MGALWALFLDRSGMIDYSVVVDIGAPAAYYDSELVGTTLYSVGLTSDYTGVVAGVDKNLGVVFVKSISISSDRLAPTAIAFHNGTGSLIILVYDYTQTSIIIMSVDLNGTVE